MGDLNGSEGGLEYSGGYADVAKPEILVRVDADAVGEPGGSLQMVEKGGGLSKEGGACRGQAHASAVPVEELGTDVVFEPADVAGETGLGDTEPGGGVTEMSF
jgi:hypothetical protein